MFTGAGTSEPRQAATVVRAGGGAVPERLLPLVSAIHPLMMLKLRATHLGDVI